MTTKDIVSVNKEVEKVYKIVNDLISLHEMDMLDLAYPEHDGEQDANAVAEMMLLRQSANGLSDACKILTQKITEAIDIEKENAN